MLIILLRNIVAFHGMVMDNDNVMIVMEFVSGGGLDHFLKNRDVFFHSKRHLE